jgi:hypothetical protein
MVLAATGFLPVTLIAAIAFGVGGLRPLSLRVLPPAVAVAALFAVRDRRLAGAIALGWTSGVVATALYDLFRFSFLWLGLMARDPIPHIGVALGLHPPFVFGYLWRYAGNGGGLGIAFFALNLRGVRAGALFGLFVCAGLVLTLALAPYGQVMLFPLSAATLVMAIGGHLLYGIALGWLCEHRAAHAKRVTVTPRESPVAFSCSSTALVPRSPAGAVTSTKHRSQSRPPS